MAVPVTFELPRDVTRIWELDVPIVRDDSKKTLDVHLAGPVEEPSTYNELCYQLRTVPSDYTVTIYLNTPGGIIDSAFMIADAIKNSPANVIGHLSGSVASAGTLLTMACDEVVVTPHLSFMIHNYSGGMMGKGHEMKARQKFVDTHLNEAFKDFYAGFLTDEEMDSIIEGTDLWMGSDEVRERWGNRQTLRESANG